MFDGLLILEEINFVIAVISQRRQIWNRDAITL